MKPTAHMGGQRSAPEGTDALVDNYDPGDGTGSGEHGHSVSAGSLWGNMAASTRLTQETFDRLQAELEDLKTRGRIEIAKAIEAARALGDLSENGDYHAAKDSQGKMEARIRQLEAMLKEPEIVDSAVGEDGVIDVGVVVALRYEGDDDIERYLIGSIEERQEGVSVISPDSALGQALKGHREGDRVEYETPTGARLAVEVVKVGG